MTRTLVRVDGQISDHESLNSLVHNLARDGYYEYAYTGKDLTSFIVWTSPAKTTKINESTFSYTGKDLTGVVTTQYAEDGTTVLYTITKVLTYNVDKDLADITTTRTEGGTPTNIVEKHAWDIAYWGNGVSGPTWTAQAGPLLTLVGGGTNATTGLSTTGLLPAGLPAALVDQGVRAGGVGNHGYFTTNPAGLVNPFIGHDWVQVRTIWRTDVAPSTTGLIGQYTMNTTEWCRFGGHNSAASWACSIRDDGDGGTAGGNTTTVGGMAADQWNVTDLVMGRTAGGGNQRTIVHTNKVTEVAADDHDFPIWPDAATLLGFGLLGQHAGASSSNDIVLFVGARGLDAEYTKAEHDVDCDLVGLSGGM